jgi:hypothetical protein
MQQFSFGTNQLEATARGPRFVARFPLKAGPEANRRVHLWSESFELGLSSCKNRTQDQTRIHSRCRRLSGWIESDARLPAPRPPESPPFRTSNPQYKRSGRGPADGESISDAAQAESGPTPPRNFCGIRSSAGNDRFTDAEIGKCRDVQQSIHGITVSDFV